MVQRFIGGGLANCVNVLQKRSNGLGAEKIGKLLDASQINASLFESACHIKQLFGQIDEVIHAIGILLVLPHILFPGEEVCGLSLAAGNTGQQFDLETTHRIAEFTFISWRGGPEVIRQNKIFKDFFFLAEEPTEKHKELYVLGTEMPLKFFKSRRRLKAILNGNAKLGSRFGEVYPHNPFTTVSDYYLVKSESVNICDISPLLHATKSNV